MNGQGARPPFSADPPSGPRPREEAPPPVEDRVLSVDAYRGFTMLMMISAGLGLSHFLRPDSGYSRADWQWQLAYQFEHVEWVGCTPWDLIQPAFMFIVGLAMPFAFAKRTARGESWGRQLGHAARRSLLLIAVGIFLDCWSNNPGNIRISIGFIRVLQQIAIGYFLCFLLLRRGVGFQLAAVAFILVTHTACYLLYNGDPAAAQPYPLRSPADWADFRPHWEPRNNFGSALDVAVLGVNNTGGYATFNAWSSTATILLGVIFGRLLFCGLSGPAKVGIMAAAGTAAIFVGLFLSGQSREVFASLGDLVGWFSPEGAATMNSIGAGMPQLPAWLQIPLVKRIWTASFAIYAAGWTILFLMIFYLVLDVLRFRIGVGALTVVGMNSIAIYTIANSLRPEMQSVVYLIARLPAALLRIRGTEGFWQSILPQGYYDWLTAEKYKTVAELGGWWPPAMAVVVLLMHWGICLWLHRRKIYFKV